MHKPRIVFDGLSGTGKSHWAKYFFKNQKDKGLTFYEGPIKITNEIKATKNHIKAFKADYNIIENSFWQSILIKQFLCNYGYISQKQFIQSKNLYEKNENWSQSYLHIFLISNQKTVKNNRDIRNREYEYIKGFDHQDELDQYILSNLTKAYQDHGINYLLINVNNPDDIKKLSDILIK